MQVLQWFPGHMASAMRMIKDNLKLVDGILIVLDARCPHASLNENMNKLFADKKVLYILNKCDLIEEKDVSRTIKAFDESNKKIVAVSTLNKKSVDFLYDAVFSLLKEKIDKNKSKGIFRPLRIMVVGVPNTGKSALINALSGGKKTMTGNKAGVTRGKQWIKIKELELLDTPGTMPPAFDNQVFARHLAYVGCMNDVNLDFNDLAVEFIKEISVVYSENLRNKYGIENCNEDAMKIFESICIRRGFIKKGNEYDYERCAMAIIDDFRKGRLGKIILD